MNEHDEFAETELGGPTFNLGAIEERSSPSEPPRPRAPRPPSVLRDEPEAPTALDGFSRGREPVDRSAPREEAVAGAQAASALPSSARPSPMGSDVPLYVGLAVIVALIVGLLVAAVVAVVAQ